MRFGVFVALFLASSPLQPQIPHVAGARPPQQSPTSVVIVELFTSEGCSSCPPADALLEQIHLKQTASGQLIVGLSEHVTYWDHLGWRDAYSDQAFTDRQNAYVQRFADQGPYTPQMVLNGREQFLGSDAAALQRALLADAKRPHAQLKIEAVARKEDGAELTFSLSGSGSRQLDIIALLTDNLDHSSVLRGENVGRSLEHVSVARSLARVAVVRGDGEQSIHLSFRKDLENERISKHHLVVIAQEPGQGAILAAATMPI